MSAAAGTVTLAALVATEAADARARGSADDVVNDEGTARLFAGAMAAAITTSCLSLIRPGRGPLPRSRALFWMGLGTTWAGLGLNRWARHTLSTNYRSLLTVVDDHKVVERGPYRLVGHPMYLGITLVCAGMAATFNTIPTAVAWTLPPLALVQRIRVEERMLVEHLGRDYESFATSRNRLVPRVW